MTATAPQAGSIGPALPPVRHGMRIGLFGGSFDPPHEGHVEVSRVAVRTLGLHRVWWLVSPQNPLKPHAPSDDLARRIEAARNLARDPCIAVTGIEAALGTRTTASMLDRLLPRLPGVRVVWMMGADNLAGFHRWDAWRSIVARVPIAVFNRPGLTRSALSSPAANAMRRHRLLVRDAASLAEKRPPAWVFLPSPHIPLSSTALRAARTANRRPS